MTLPLVDVLQSEEAVLTRLRKQQLIESMEQISPIYLEGIKHILIVSADTEVSFSESVAIERELQQQLFQSEDAKEGIAAHTENRQAQFKAR